MIRNQKYRQKLSPKNEKRVKRDFVEIDEGKRNTLSLRHSKIGKSALSEVDEESCYDNYDDDGELHNDSDEDNSDYSNDWIATDANKISSLWLRSKSIFVFSVINFIVWYLWARTHRFSRFSFITRVKEKSCHLNILRLDKEEECDAPSQISGGKVSRQSHFSCLSPKLENPSRIRPILTKGINPYSLILNLLR